MGEQVRRVRLLVAVSVTALLAFAAWPSAAAPMASPPLYLARDLDEGHFEGASRGLVAVGDGPRLAAHLLSDGQQLAGVEVVDSAGQVVVLRPSGTVVATGSVIEPAVVKGWLVDSFKARSRAVDQQLKADVSNKVCWTAKQNALAWLNLTGYEGPRELTLAETLAEADRRITLMHQPANEIPVQCVADPNHRAGYLHNLWHRITGTA